MDQQGVVEPVEEVGYKNRPPLLEDVSVEGPLRIPIPHALDTLEQREAIEEDYNWWRYSKFAAPWLFFMLLLFASIFTMTAFEQAGDIRRLRDGVPRYFQWKQSSTTTGVPGYEGSKDSTEGGIRKVTRNLRIAEVWCCFTPCVLAFIVLYMKPRPVPRKVLHYLCAFILFCGMVLAWAAFGMGEADSKNAQRCPELYIFTNEACDNRVATAEGALALDFLIAIFSLTGFILLVYTTYTGDFKLNRTGWRQQERDAETESPQSNPYNIKAHNQHVTRLALTSIVLGGVILLTIALAVMIVILHQNHNTINLRGYRGRTNRFGDRFTTVEWEETGWSARNTRLRYALSGIGCLTVLLNFIPWRSRVIAYIFAFIYFDIMVMALVCFALDVWEIRHAKFDAGWGCPQGWFTGITQDLPIYKTVQQQMNCISSPFIAECIVEFFAAMAILIYIINEYVIRYQSIHSQRKYPWFEIKKIEQELDSKRPVRCEITSQVMTAGEYYYRHRFLTEEEMLNAGANPPQFMGAYAYDQPPATFQHVLA